MKQYNLLLHNNHNNHLFEGAGGALSDILNQTHVEGGWRNMNGGNYDRNKMLLVFKVECLGAETKVVSSVDEMMASNKKPKTSDINQISIDAVPDFSGLMGKMKESGKI